MDTAKALTIISPENILFLDKYLDLLISGERFAARKLAENYGESFSKITKFLNSPAHKKYINEKLKTYLDCKDIDKFKILEEIRALAFSNIGDILETDPNNSNNIRAKNLSNLPKEVLAGIASIKITKFGLETNIDIRMHNKLNALKLLADIQAVTEKDAIPEETNNDQPKRRLFDLAMAEGETIDVVKTEEKIETPKMEVYEIPIIKHEEKVFKKDFNAPKD